MPDCPNVQSVCDLLDQVQSQTGLARACMWGALRGTAPANRWGRAAADLAAAQAALAEAVSVLALVEKQEPYCTVCNRPLLLMTLSVGGWAHFAASQHPREIEPMSAGHDPALDWRPVAGADVEEATDA